MKPDIDFLISVDTSKKNDFISYLSSFCVNTDLNTFNSDLIKESCDILFLIEEEEATMWFKEEYVFSRGVKEKILIGMISLDISDYNDGTTVFKFWPVFGHGGKVCLDSKVLKKHFIEVLKKVNGYDIVLYENGTYSKSIYENRKISDNL